MINKKYQDYNGETFTIYIHDISNVYHIYIHDISNVILSVKKRFEQIILILLHHTFYII